MNLNTNDWQPFKTSRLFYDMQNGKANQQILEEGNDCFYVGAKRDDNGVMMHCLKDEDLITKGNCIVFICNGEGSVGYANYMDVDFIGTTDIVAGYNDYLNPYVGAFLATIYSLERPKYSFGRKWKTKLAGTVVNLPIQHDNDGTPFIDETKKFSDEGYVPDWQFMEDYIKSLHHKPLTTKNKSGQVPDLNVQNWGEFALTSVFTHIESGKVSNAGDLDEGDDLPYLGAKKNNNGVMQMCMNNDDKRSRGNCIIMICDGEGSVGYANYMESDFLGTVNLMLGYNDKYLNPYTGVFLATVLSQERPKYSFGRKWKTHIPDTVIKLPIQHNNDGSPFIDETKKYSVDGYVPDWQFMEDYIKTLPYGDRLINVSYT